MSCIFTSMSFSPMALSRPNSKSHQKLPKKNISQTPKPSTNLRHSRRHSPPPDPSPQPQSLASHGTTYTRLPPKDDFFDDSLHDPDEVELSESSVVKVKVDNGGKGIGLNESEDFEGDADSVLGLGYKRLDVFEGSLKVGDVEDEYEEGKTVTYYINEDFDDDQDDVFGSSYRRLDVFEGSMKFDDEEEEDESDDVEGRTVTYYAGEDFDDDDEDEEEEDESDDVEVRTVTYYAGEDFDDEEEDESDDVEGRTVTHYAGEDFDDDEEEEKEVKFGAEDGKNDQFEGAEDDDERFKEKGVPAVMRCFDRAKIYVKAGDGGNGVVAFRREKYVPLGGPSGGDGGRGGNVYVEVDGSMNSLLPFRKAVHFRAERGAHGQGRKQAGAKGEDVVVKVAPGTCIREAGKDDVLLELLHPGQRALLLPGGRGGRGNASFKSGMNKVPRIAENGEMGTEMWLELELKLVADVGIVGAPNAGKSTLLSAISAAQPSIANYPFTTLLPNLGVVSFDYDSTIVVADLPGLLEGAHRGFGLGHEFLRHTERCSALIHVVDGSSPQPELEFDAVRLELEMFSPELAEKPFIVAYNKMDLPEAYENWTSFKNKLQSNGIEPFYMSALRRDSTHEVITAAYELLQKNKEANKEFKGWAAQDNLNHVAETVEKRRKTPINDFNVSYDKSSNTFHVVGSGLQRFVQMTNWRYMDSDKRFQYVLEACGVNKALTKLGVKEGDTVMVGEMEMVWHDSTAKSASSNVASAKSNY